MKREPRPLRNDLTQEQVKDLFDYRDGKIYWRNYVRNIRKGDEAGCVTPEGYLLVGIKRKHYLVHRVIWLWHKGYMPEGIVDHKDQDRLNNRIDNLREASDQCNVINSKVHCSNTSGVKGISRSKISGKWHSYLEHNGKRMHLGFYDNFADAVAARWEKEVELDWSTCETTSSSFLYLKDNGLLPMEATS